MTRNIRAVPTRVQALVAVVLAALFFFGLQAPAAHAADEVDLTVTVTTKAGTPLSGINVYAYPVALRAAIDIGETATAVIGKPGQFRFSGLSALDAGQEYALYFDAPASNTTTFDQFSGGVTWIEDATYLSWSPGDQTLAISLATNTNITGKVTGVSSKALANVVVYPYRFDGSDWYLLADPACDGCVVSAKTSSTGVYVLRNLEPGSYRLEFAPDNKTGYLSEFSGNVRTLDTAAAIYAGLGTTSTVNAVLATGGRITGSVTYEFEGDPYFADGVTAFAYPLVGSPPLVPNRIDRSVRYASSVTGVNGVWIINGLPAGYYAVNFEDTGYETLDEYWSQNAQYASGATPIRVIGTGTASGGRTDLPDDSDPSSVSIHVQSSTTAASIEGAHVTVTAQDSAFHWDGYTDSTGLMTIPRLPNGDFDVAVEARDDDGASLYQPSITEQSSPNAPGPGWTIQLAPVSPFQWTSNPSVAEAATKAGTTYHLDVPDTTMNDGALPESPVYTVIQWLRDGKPVFGATGTTYVSRGADVGTTLSVLVRAYGYGFPSIAHVVTIGEVTPGDAPMNLSPPSISAPASVVPGATLTANTGTWDQPGLRYSYQWLSNDVVIPGATARTYKLAPLDALNDIRLDVTATRPGFGTTTESTTQLPVGALAPLKQTKSSVVTKVTAGVPVGSLSYRITSGTWSPVAGSYSYQWIIDGVDFEAPTIGASSTLLCETTIECPPASVIQVRVTALRTGYTDGSRTFLIRKGTIAPAIDTAAIASVSTAPGVPLNPTDAVEVGRVLTATPPVLDWSGYPPGTQVVAYQWQISTNNGVSWTNISKATKSAYKIPTTVVNRLLRVRISVSSANYSSTVTYAAAGTARLKQNLVVTHPTLQINGSDDVATTKWVQLTGPWGASAVTQSYQWFGCDLDLGACADTTVANTNWKPIAKATAASFVVPAAPAYEQLLVRVIGSKSGYQGRELRSPAVVLGPRDDTWLLATPTITSGPVSGNALVGRTLIAKVSIVDQPVTSRTYEWQACNVCDGSDWTAIPGATSTVFVPTGDLLTAYPSGKIRFVELVKTPAVLSGVNGNSPAYPLVAGTFAPTMVPKVTGTTTYSVSTGTWPAATLADPTFQITREWYVGNTGSGETGASFTPAAPSGTEPVWVKVTVTREGFTPLTYNLVARKGTLSLATPALSGAVYGDTLQLDDPLSVAVPVPVIVTAPTFAYQWYSGTAAIKGQTKPTFVPSTSYIGKALKLRIAVSSPFYTSPRYVYSTPVLFALHPAPSAAPTIVSSTGAFKPGAKLSVAKTGYPSGTTFTYMWQRSTDGLAWSNVTKASSFVLTTSDPGKQYRVLIVGKRTGWATSPATPTPVITADWLGPLGTVGPLAINGTGAVGSALSVAPVWNTTSVTVTYKWLRNGVIIPGATSSTFVPLATSFGDEIDVAVTASKAGYQPVTVMSNTVKVGQALALAPTSTPLTINPSVARLGMPVTVSSAWSVDGLTFTYEWYDVDDPGVLLGAAPTFTPPSGTSSKSYLVIVTASKPGYADGTKSRIVVAAP